MSLLLSRITKYSSNTIKTSFFITRTSLTCCRKNNLTFHPNVVMGLYTNSNSGRYNTFFMLARNDIQYDKCRPNNECFMTKRFQSQVGGTKKKKQKKKNKKISNQKRNNDKQKHTNHNMGKHSVVQQPKIPKNAILHPVQSADEEMLIPPLFIHSTASPNAYIASCAVEELNIHPKEIFQECASFTTPESEGESSSTTTKQMNHTIPSSFKYAKFEYVPPKDFNFELPTHPIPEVAILGRSNVGKSSLLNALTKQKIARTSKTPGRTQQVNYFALCHGEPSKTSTLGHVIDLPGYGYAKAPDKKVDLWQKRTQEFLQQRHYDGHLQRVYLLIDSRHGVLEFDHVVMKWLDEAQIPYMLVMTKGDSVGKSTKIRYVNEIAMRYHYQSFSNEENDDDDDNASLAQTQSPIILLTSSKNREGIIELMWSIDADFIGGREKLSMRY